jgi:DNA-directed RNA polymerase specialized sigma24 family protein
MEEREMVRLRRLENKTFEEIALSLNRDTEAIKLRFEKLLMEHTDGESDVSEALRWFNLSA